MLSIRKATAHDAPLILDFIRRLAEYEREPDAVVATEEDLIRDGFGSEPKYRCLIAEWDGAPAGFALFLLQLLHLAGQAGAVPGRSFCPGGDAWQRHWQSAADQAGTDRHGGKLLWHALDGAGMERSGAEVL